MFLKTSSQIITRSMIVFSAALMSFSTMAHNETVYLDQGWTQAQRQAFYETPQGSLLIPLKWYLALEKANSSKLFSKKGNIKDYNYIIKNSTDGSVLNLPVGFAVEPQAGGEDWMGYTCAGCHTTEIEYNNKNIRIDGGPALADFASFISDLHQAVILTSQDNAKFSRFAQRVLGDTDPSATLALREELISFADDVSAFDSRNQTSNEYGYGRLDAFGIIMNEVFGDDLHAPVNINEPNAPVSYPYLWGTPRHDWVQWNGSANNPFGRNVGEVLGTFGKVDLVNLSSLGQSSARGLGVIQLESLVASLQTPYWPEQYLGAIDQAKATQGRAIYERSVGGEHSCSYCHALKDATGQYPLTPAEENAFGVQFVLTEMTPLSEIGTDPTMALNFATRTVSTAHLAPFLPAPFTGATELPAPALLSILVGLASQNSIAQIDPPLTQAETLAAIGFRVKAPSLPPYRPKNLLAYRAAPLEGVWATAPYLHNGSVQNLADLLTPPSQRKSSFYVGSRDFDPVNVGFEGKEDSDTSLLDTSLQGNSNAGHDYGVYLTAQEKDALIEFMKTL